MGVLIVVMVDTNRNRIVRRLAADGWVLVRHGGDHDIWRNAKSGAVVAVPRHRELSIGVARTIERIAGWRQR